MLRSQFLAYWSQSSFGKKYFVLSSKQSTNLASINSTQLHNFPVAWPHLEEQQRIEDRLGTADGQLAGLQNELAKLSQLKAGMMHDLLTGSVSVAVERTPEPKETAANV
ncbi:restriction endonuclease subunit S [Thiorhodococcus mannitoliphagus]|nr:restriction endonuclease subunit S [Thiorhodococcus mannitoliphagus]